MRSLLARADRGQLTLLGILATLLVAAALIVPPSPTDRDSATLPPLSIHSNEVGGARALSLWLKDLGYQTVPIEYRRSAVDSSVRLLFVLALGVDLTDAHAATILEWVRRGGTLVLAADRPNPLYDQLGIRLRKMAGTARDAVPAQPIYVQPPLRQARVDTSDGLRLDGPQWVPLLAAPEASGEVVAAVSTLGEGRVFVTTSIETFSNDGLPVADDWAFVVHLLDGVPAGSKIAFDEYHHGLTEQGSLGALMVHQPWGWSIFYAGVLVFAYVASRGRRFGRAIAWPELGSRRSRREYVSTLGALLRQGQHGEWLRQNYLAHFKRELGTHFGVRPDLPTGELIAALAERRADAADLAKPLTRLERAVGADDATVVALMAELDRLRERLVAS